MNTFRLFNKNTASLLHQLHANENELKTQATEIERSHNEIRILRKMLNSNFAGLRQQQATNASLWSECCNAKMALQLLGRLPQGGDENERDVVPTLREVLDEQRSAAGKPPFCDSGVQLSLN